MNEIPTPVVLALIALVSGVLGAFITAVSKKWRTPADDATDRKMAIEADEKLLARFEAMLAERDVKIDALDRRVTELNAVVEGLTRERNVLIDYIYALIRFIRDADLMQEVPVPPPGIHISGLPVSALGNPPP
jgi:hypothetical protein